MFLSGTSVIMLLAVLGISTCSLFSFILFNLSKLNNKNGHFNMNFLELLFTGFLALLSARNSHRREVYEREMLLASKTEKFRAPRFGIPQIYSQ